MHHLVKALCFQGGAGDLHFRSEHWITEVNTNSVSNKNKQKTECRHLAKGMQKADKYQMVKAMQLVNKYFNYHLCLEVDSSPRYFCVWVGP